MKERKYLGLCTLTFSFPDFGPLESSPSLQQIVRGLGWIFGLFCDTSAVMAVVPSGVIRSVVTGLVVVMVTIPIIRYSMGVEREVENKQEEEY